jgi:hypothetical protein
MFKNKILIYNKMERRLTKKLSSEYARIARKASFWQNKYDEWKKYGAIYPSFKLSKFITDDLLQNYMDKGWNTLTNNYKNNVNNINFIKDNKYKENKTVEEEELILGILGSIRKYMVKTIFKCVQEKICNSDLNELTFSGSENLTSDYDVSIIGPNGNEIMWRMFITFLAKYSDSFPKAFDTNLYSGPIYAHSCINNNESIICKSNKELPQRVDFNNYFTLVPFTKDDIKCELTWVCIKLLDNLNVIYIPNFLEVYINEAKKYKLKMDDLLKQTDKNKIYLDISLQNNLHPANSITKNTRKLIKNYFLQYTWQEYIHKYIYSSDNINNCFIKNKIKLEGKNTYENNIFFYSNISNYFSCDAYYTSSSVNSIVIEDQRNIKLNLEHLNKNIKEGMYIISAIENLSDMVNHLINSVQPIEISIIKYSKYLYRIYRCLGKVDDKYFKQSHEINKNVIPFRRSYNIKKAKELKIFKYLFYDKEYNLNDYLFNLSKSVFNDINKLILNNKIF